MRPEDRNALHETMEQQSYHPSVEILLANGHRVSIGAYVDRLFEAHREQVILGKDCEILRLADLPPLYEFDPETRQVRKTQIDRVSRHAAPTEFVRIQYSNGRHILVTPDHPTLVWREEAIRNVPASKVGVGDFVPAVRQLPNSATAVVLEDAKLQRVHEKSVRLQSSLTPELAAILGFLLTEGYAYKGRTTEIGFTNTDSELLQRFRSLMRHEFELVPIADENQAGVIILRYVSTRLYRWLATNFDELLHTAREKRIPSLIMGASAGIAAAFLRAAFRGDGSVEPEAICFRTASAGLARDYQDLLLKLGISSRITPDRTNVSFKVYVVAHSLQRFAALLLERTDSRYLQVQGMIQRSQRVHRRHDVLPTDVGPTIRHLYRALGLPYRGYFDEHVKGGFGIAVETMLRFAKLLRERLETVQRQFAANTTLRMLRERLGWSQSALAAAVGVPRSRIAYAEAGGYSNNARRTLTVRCVAAVKRVLENAEDKLNHLEGITALRFLRITSVEIIRNEGPAKTEWVYDLTVEPYHTFVSHGVILHNTVSVAKGGIVATLNARTSLLAAANPVLGKYDPYRNITDNVNLPIPLLTRFDLIFVLRDVPERDRDEALAKHVLEIHRRGEYVSAPPIEFEMLKKYLAYAKKVVPVLTKDAEEKMLDYYLQMRSMGSESMITVTPRQLEAIIRIATARARLLLREKVTEEDAIRAISLMRRMLESYAGIDAKTGKFDLGVLHGRPLSERNLLEIALDTFKALEGPEKNPVEGKRFVEELVKTKKFGQDEAQRYLQMLNRSGQIYEVKPGFYRKL